LQVARVSRRILRLSVGLEPFRQGGGIRAGYDLAAIRDIEPFTLPAIIGSTAEASRGGYGSIVQLEFGDGVNTVVRTEGIRLCALEGIKDSVPGQVNMESPAWGVHLEYPFN